MDDKSLADRLVNYADALVAVSFLGGSGLALALADPDVRCSVVHGFRPVIIGNLASAVVVSVSLVILRRWEIDLRLDAGRSRKAETYSRRLHVARFLVVWISVAAAIVTLVAAASDPSCAVGT